MYVKRVHDRTILLKRGCFTHSFTPPHFMKCLYQARKANDHVYVYVLKGLDFISISTIFRFDFGTVLTVWYFRTVVTVWYFKTVVTVWYFRTVLTVWYFRTVLTVWYFRTVQTAWYFRTVLTVWYFRTVLTVWYFRTVLSVVFLSFYHHIHLN